MAHAQLVKDLGLHKLLPARAGDLPYQQAGDHIHDILVLKGIAQVAGWLQVAQPVENLAPAEIRAIPHQVMAGKPRAVRQQVAWRHMFRRNGILQPETGQVFSDRFVPIELARLHQQSDRHRGKRFAARGDGEQGLRRNRQVVLDVSQPKTLAQDHLPVLDHGHRQPRHMPELERLLDEWAQFVHQGCTVHRVTSHNSGSLQPSQLFRRASGDDVRGHSRSLSVPMIVSRVHIGHMPHSD